MILYHGTTTKHLEGILKNGIQPTGKTGLKSYWDIESAGDRVYLSDTYALYYALSSAMAIVEDENGIEDETEYDAVVLKVEVDEDCFMPDEDFLAQAFKKPHGDILKDTLFYRDLLHTLFTSADINELGHFSLQHLGTVCVSSVEPSEIIEYTVIPNKKCIDVMLDSCDPTITLLHHQILGERYKADLKALRDKFETHQV